ncbi:MAG: hypothetical protein A3F72_17550 [Bacteroidetes bacterium RIFCSPLOWO2_12_FULL_35_15]|nr:MAG: hypothetical protein A3F72_17550 [Bacteroidetes bacterium RIFCSPLOWO2_12_FULL_35_15]
MPSTIPATANSTGNSATNKFLGVNNIAADPTNPNRIYAATRYGLQMTDDGGVTWVHSILYVNGSPNISRTTDVDVASDGTVITSLSGRGYISANGNSGTFTIIPTTAGLATSGIGRTEFAFAPSDPNYIYAVIGNSSGLLKGVYQSIDKGVSWTLIGNGGTTQFEPFGSASQAGQADYDMALAVAPSNKTSIIIGGVSLWGWCATNQSSPSIGQWKEAATLSEFYYATTIPRPDYVHADVHTIKFSTTNPNTMYIGCDGGVFRSTNVNPTFIPTPNYIRSNHNYNVSQLYSIAYESDNIYGTGVIGGLQDNGTQYISGTGNTAKTAKHIDGGDGAECEISFLNPGVSFSTVYYGALARHATKGSEGSDFYSYNISSQLNANTLSASFVTPIALYETKTATNSPDSVMFINGVVSQILGSGNGANKHFTGYLILPQQSASFVPDSIEITSGLKKVNDNGLGTLTGDVDLTQTNTFDYATGYYDFYFNAAPALGAPVNASFYVKYASGSNISITRSDYVSPLNFTTTLAIDPNDTVMVYDPFQAKLAVGFTGHVYMTKGCLDFSGIPAWLHIGTIVGTSEELAWSADGDILYVGTDAGNLYRFSNLAAVKDSVTGDIASPGCVVVKTQIAGFGRFITGLSVDPSDADKLAVSLGSYGNTTYVHYSSTAATCATSTSTSNFTLKQGTGTTKLPAMPVYSILIEKNDPKRVIVGTEYGIYSTSDITAANPVWSTDNGINQKFPNTPVFKIRQQRRDGSEVTNPYVIYAGTHGRGAWKSETFIGPLTIGINEPNSSVFNSLESGIKIYPNPMTEKGTVAFNLASTSSVIVSIYNLQGKLVKSIKSGLLIAGDQKIEINTAEFSKGTYLLSIDGSAVHATSKFVVVK